MAVPTTKATFKNYCLRNLGYGVIDINISDDQADDRIDEALQYFAMHHYNGIERMYLKYLITADDVTRARSNLTNATVTDTGDGSTTASWLEGKNYIPVPSPVMSVVNVFPFEETLYEQEKIPVDFVGHPLLDLCQGTDDKEGILRENGFDPNRPTVALLPGSRPNEVQSILPDLVSAALLIRQRIPGVQFLIARAPDLDDRLFEPLLDLLAAGQSTVVLESQTDNVLKASDFVVTASGTATVQAAIHGRPMVIVYRVSSVTYRLVRAFANVDAVGMVNLIAGRKIVPELIQDVFTPQAVCDEVVGFLLDPARAIKVCRELKIVREQLGCSGASRRAAELVLSEAHRNHSPLP